MTYKITEYNGTDKIKLSICNDMYVEVRFRDTYIAIEFLNSQELQLLHKTISYDNFLERLFKVTTNKKIWKIISDFQNAQNKENKEEEQIKNSCFGFYKEAKKLSEDK